MPKTEHYQWYVEQFSPTELHHHAIEELYYAGRTQEEAAAILNISASTVFRRWTAARLTLQSRLGKGGE